MCLASHNNHPTSLASSWDISFLKSLVQQDPKGSNKVAHHLILDVYVSPNRKYVNLSIIYYITDFTFFISQDDAYFHIHQNDPPMVIWLSISPLKSEKLKLLLMSMKTLLSVTWPYLDVIKIFDHQVSITATVAKAAQLPHWPWWKRFARHAKTWTYR